MVEVENADADCVLNAAKADRVDMRCVDLKADCMEKERADSILAVVIEDLIAARGARRAQDLIESIL